MAIMIPNRPHSFAPASLEGVMFEALEKLSDEYYVFHSLRISTVVDNYRRHIYRSQSLKQRSEKKTSYQPPKKQRC